MTRILIVKTSSLGDIIQSLHVLSYLHQKFPGVQVDWVAESAFASIVKAHPLVHRTVVFDLQGVRKSWNGRKLIEAIRQLRACKYDLVFDLQKNTKSGFITALTRSPMKVGFGLRSVREWPNVLAMHKRFEIPGEANIRLQYVGLIQKFLRDEAPFQEEGVRFHITPQEQEVVQSILALTKKIRIMVCPGSKWNNKRLPVLTMGAFLAKIHASMEASFLLMWGDADEKAYCQEIRDRFLGEGIIIDKLPIPMWQNLMNEMDLVIAVDSAALHLCGTTKTPSFSLFGPTAPQIFKPMGKNHFAVQGTCPYERTFAKQCPVLRTCPTGACIRGLKVDELFQTFQAWWKTTAC
jgi:heptosyltransferase-1